MRIAIEAERCSGCRVCELICALANRGENNPKLGAIRIVGRFPDPGRYEVVLCDQCGACAEVCPVEAISERNGVFHIDAELCTGCAACVEECPQEAFFEHPSQSAPFKCTACGECVAYCPRGVLRDLDGEIAPLAETGGKGRGD